VDEAAAAEMEGSERTCIVTRRRGAPETMIRFVRAPDGVVTPDIRARLPGRGVWVGACAALVAQAARKSLFARGFREASETPGDLVAQVERLLEGDCLQTLALANKAGKLICGFNKVADALGAGGVALLLSAQDGGADGKRKLRQFARRAGGDPPPEIGLFTSTQLDLALGRVNVIHAALAPCGLTENFLARCARLSAYRGVALTGDPTEEAENTEEFAGGPGPSGTTDNFIGPMSGSGSEAG